MKRILPIILLVCVLSSCTNQSVQEVSYTLEEVDSTEFKTADVAAEYTNINSNVWQTEVNDGQLTVIECPDFSTAIWVSDKTYIVQADILEEVRPGLVDFGIADCFDLLIREAPVVFIPGAAESGWVDKEVGPYTLPFPNNSVWGETGWQTNDVMFQVLEGVTKEDQAAELDAMLSDVTEAGITGFTLWYEESMLHQAMCWKLDESYYVSIATYDSYGMCILTLAKQNDLTQATELAEIYGMGIYLSSLLDSGPIFEN